jgi:hypothetical protein
MKKLLLFPFILSLFGCYASGHRFYESFEYSPQTNDCTVIWTLSFDMANYKLQNQLPPVKFLGRSHFSTSLYYNRETARNDCMLAGGDYIIVVERGLTDSQTQTVQRNQTHLAFSYTGTTSTTTIYTVPTYYTYTTNYYGYSYFVYKKVSNYKVYKPGRK